MNNTSLYQKYRPTNFSQVIGQDFVIKTIINSIKMNRIGHAYIFSGPKGIGKTTIAKIFSKAINCLQFKNDICDVCENCKLIQQNEVIDIVEIDAASNNSVDNARNIIETSHFLPTVLKYKVYIIDEAHMLTTSAWNALLKTLEDPSPRVIYIFATTEVHKIPSTIVSRCQTFEFSRLTNSQLLGLVNTVAEKEKIKIDKESLDILISLSEGSARDALSILEQCSLYSNNDITKECIYDLFGLVDINEKIKLLKLIIANKSSEVIKIIDEFENKGVDFIKLTTDLTYIFVDLLIYSNTKDLNLVKSFDETNINTIQIDKNKLVEIINLCQNYYSTINLSNNVKLSFEIFIFNLADLLNKSHNVSSKHVEQTKELKPGVKKPTENNVNNSKQWILDNFNKIYTTKEIQIKTDNDIKRSEKVVDVDIEKICIQIINNRSSEYIKNARNLFNELIEENKFNDNFSYLINGKKVIVASQNGMIILFDDQIDAELLNKHITNTEVQKKIIKKISQPYYIVGCDKQYILNLKEKVKEYTNNNIYSEEPDLSYLRNKLKESNELGTFAFEIFGKID